MKTTIQELTPRFYARKSFGGKAQIVFESNGDITLFSYEVPVVRVPNNDVPVLTDKWNYSSTTIHHVYEFLNQRAMGDVYHRRSDIDRAIKAGQLKAEA